MPRYLIKKTQEPESFGQAYVANLPQLPGDEELIMGTEDGGLLKVRDIPEDVEAQQVAQLRGSRRPHILMVEPVETIYAHVTAQEEAQDLSPQYTMPDAATLAYMRADKLSEDCDGSGVTVIGGDTGMDFGVAQTLRNKRINVLPGKNYTSSNVFDTEDRHGHGTATGAMCVLGTRASYMPHKVLGDDGAGDSVGIIKSIRDAGDYAASHPDEMVVYNGSYGSDQDSIYSTYRDAILYATTRGVFFVFSAGNANRNIIGRPANVCRVNARVASSIAFDKRIDRRADFSNYDEDGTISAPGVREVGYGKDGRLYYNNGTSFSGPQTTYLLVRLASKYGLPEAYAALVKNGRNSPEPTVEEGGGVVDGATANTKLQPPKPEPPEPEPEEMSRWAFSRAKVPGLEKWEGTITYSGDPLGTFKGKDS